MKKAPVAIGAVAAIAVGIFVALSVGQTSRPAENFKCFPTENNIEGPYYRPGAPAWQVPTDLQGTRLVVMGKVVDHNCEPVSGAVLDFWQTDSKGEYDNSGYVLRGKIEAGEDGSYRLDTIQPAKYETRPAHIHVKVWDKGRELLTTQLYIIENDKDEFVRDSLIIEPQGQGGNRTASFDFVVLR